MACDLAKSKLERDDLSRELSAAKTKINNMWCEISDLTRVFDYTRAELESMKEN